MNRKKSHSIWSEKGFRVPLKPRRKRGGVSTCPITNADAQNVVWTIDFQLDSLRRGTPMKHASMADEYTRESLLDITDRPITSEKVINYLEEIIAEREALLALRCDNGPEFISIALGEFAEEKIGIQDTIPGHPGETDTKNLSTVASATNAST